VEWATEHLLEDGRRRIAAVGADVTTNNVGPARARLRGYEMAHEQAGLQPPAGLEITTGGWTRSSGYAAVDGLVRGGTPFDALFCFNDLLALGAVRALHDRGIAVPREVSVVGWDDIQEAEFSVPSLTSVSPNKNAIAATAVDVLLDQIAGNSAQDHEIVCEHELVVRESSRRN
jgi:LacI family repressor for deo operon, udp, cdd, tsx, nupC, and nupG